MVARRDDVHAGGQERIGGRRRETHPARDVLAVGGHEVDAALLAQVVDQLLDGDPAGLADQVADHQDATGAARSWGVAVRRIAEARSPDRALFRFGGHARIVAGRRGRPGFRSEPRLERQDPGV
jgi:hypothetical protein